MRHIVINILLIFAFLGCFGQTQQSLKNGFVAATDSGVYYLQDGFDEWVRFRIDGTNFGSIYLGDIDTILSISTNKKEIYTNVMSYNGANNRLTQIKIYNKDFYTNRGAQGLGGEVQDFTKGMGEARYKKNNIFSFVNSIPPYSSNIYIYDEFNTLSGYFYNYTFSLTSICSDKDSILVCVGYENKILRVVVTDIAASRDTSSISGLHSRLTDTHKICYNPDDDEFIIVSDSGIVYSYDKTTLTTIDTLTTSTGLIYSIIDMKYFNDFIYLLIKESDQTEGNQRFYKYEVSTKTLTTLATLTNSADGALAIDPIHSIVMWHYGGGGQYYDILGDKRYGIPPPDNRIVFDLDYINYLPD